MSFVHSVFWDYAEYFETSFIWFPEYLTKIRYSLRAPSGDPFAADNFFLTLCIQCSGGYGGYSETSFMWFLEMLNIGQK